MGVNADTLNVIIETVKKFFQDLIKPDMTIEKVAEVASPQLDKIIKKNAEQGLKYNAGKFKIEYLDDKHFSLEFEMYFKDEAGKWYKAANKSEPRDSNLIEPSSWKTLKALKVVEFPIGAPENLTESKVAKEVVESEPLQNETTNAKTSPEEDVPAQTESKSDITLEKLMEAKKAETTK